MGFRSGGRRFQIGVAMVSDWWLWALDRVAVGFRLSFRLWDFGGRGVVCGCGFCSLWTVLGLMGFVRHSILHLPLYEASLSSLVWFFFFLFLAMGLFFGWILIVVVVGSPWVCHAFGFAVE